MDDEVLYEFIGANKQIPGVPARSLTAVDLEKLELDGYPLPLLEKSGLYRKAKAKQAAPKKSKAAPSKAQALPEKADPDLIENGIDPLEDEK